MANKDKDKLIQVNRWNKRKFTSGNLFGYGDLMDNGQRNLDIPGGFIEGSSSGLSWNDYTPPNPNFDNLELTSNPIKPTKVKKSPNWAAIGMASRLAGTMNSALQANGVKIGDRTPTRGVYDLADPLWWAANGNESTVGNVFSDAGTTAFEVGMSTGNPWIMLGGGIAKAVGSGINAVIGTKENKENIAALKKNTKIANDTGYALGHSNTFQDVLANASSMTSSLGFKTTDLVTGGWAKSAKRKAEKSGQAYNNTEALALNTQTEGLKTGIINANNTQSDNLSKNWTFALGGPIGNPINDTGMGAIDYGFMSDYLANYKARQQKQDNITNMFAGTPNVFALGGEEDEDPWEGVPNRDLPPSVLLRRLEQRREAARKPKPVPGVFGGGEFGGAGTSGRITEGRIPVEEEQSDTLFVPYARTFEDAFRNARAQGLTEFEFNGQRYNTQMGNNPNNNAAARSRVEEGVLPLIWNRKKKKYERTGKAEYALGGDLQTHGADWSTGATTVNAGGTHEENPYEGVQMGVDPEGTPNLVEEGEMVYNDYVYSNRIPIDDVTKQKFHIGKKREMTYADLAKKLEKEIAERPNDPISKAGFKMQMGQLAEEQERQKQEMEAERAKEAFEALSPEEQVALMQKIQQQEQMAQEAAMQEQAAMEQQQMMNGAQTGAQMSPEEMAMMQQQQMQETPQMGQPDIVQGQPVMAYGGMVNRFDGGGVLQLLNKLGYKTVAEAEKAGWKPSDFGNFTDWKQINNNTKLSDDFEWNDEFSKRITSPELKAALSLGWNPVASLVGRKWYEGDNGNSIGWTQSYGKNAINAEEFKDYAQRYKNTLGWAVDNGIIKAPEGNGTISMSDIVKAMRQSPDWKKTDEWLYSDPANMASYLGMARGLNPDDDTKFINKWSPYGSFTKGEDGQWTYNLKPDLSNADRQAFIDLFKKARTDNKIGVMYNNFSDPASVTNKYVLDEDGNPVLLTTDDLSGYEQLGTYSWGDEPNNINNNAIIYKEKTPAASSTTAAKPSNTEDEWTVEPNYKADWLRYAGLLEPAIGLGMQALNIGRPNTKGLDASLDILNNVATVSPEHIGGYYAYRPDDPFLDEIQAGGANAAAIRGGTNNAAPIGNQQAFILAADNNLQNNAGRRRREGQRYNNAERLTELHEQKDTDKWNVGTDNEFAKYNADTINRNSQLRAQLGMQAAAQKMDADAAWYNGIYGNVGGIFKGIGDLGRENAEHNMIAEMAANGIFGKMTPQTKVGKRGRYLTWHNNNSAAKGGKLNKKGRK